MENQFFVRLILIHSVLLKISLTNMEEWLGENREVYCSENGIKIKEKVK